jgi:hypothetical protein
MSDVVDISPDATFYRDLQFPLRIVSKRPSGAFVRSYYCAEPDKLHKTLEWCRRENRAKRNILLRMNGFVATLAFDGRAVV